MQIKEVFVFSRTEKETHELIKKKRRAVIQIERGEGKREEMKMPDAKLEAKKRKGKVMT
jgi:hypothetical protein